MIFAKPTIKTKPKYKNIQAKYKDMTFHSKKECLDYIWLENLLRAGKIKRIDRQHKIKIDVNGAHICNHYVDFEVELADGRIKWIETKGMPTDAWQIKKKLVQALYDIQYLVNPKEKEVMK